MDKLITSTECWRVIETETTDGSIVYDVIDRDGWSCNRTVGHFTVKEDAINHAKELEKLGFRWAK